MLRATRQKDLALFWQGSPVAPGNPNGPAQARPSLPSGQGGQTPVIPSTVRPLSQSESLAPVSPGTAGMGTETATGATDGAQEPLTPAEANEVPMTALIPAFLISELKTAFQLAFVIYIPFLVIDMVVASSLMSMGMIMLPPVMISLPFKILLFVLADGWNLIVGSLLRSYQ
ncbi:MAG: EscR/YscR/HrcR family type III secretion system export apparatus protein [Limnochordaceae bacterium]|nr:EscR/YscR/HrcR family type III secretion system export apparatus protein [Limnochordaceae bacterium]